MKTFPVVLEDVLHYALKTAALKDHITMHEFVIQAIKEKINRVVQKG